MANPDDVRVVQTMADGTVVYMTVMPGNRNKARIVELPPDSSAHNPVVNGHSASVSGKDNVSTVNIMTNNKK
jgi:hypothetical protein